MNTDLQRARELELAGHLREVDVRLVPSVLAGRRRAILTDVSTGEQIEPAEFFYTAHRDEIEHGMDDFGRALITPGDLHQECWFTRTAGGEQEWVKVRRWIPDARTRRILRRQLARAKARA